MLTHRWNILRCRKWCASVRRRYCASVMFTHTPAMFVWPCDCVFDGDVWILNSLELSTTGRESTHVLFDWTRSMVCSWLNAMKSSFRAHAVYYSSQMTFDSFTWVGLMTHTQRCRSSQARVQHIQARLLPNQRTKPTRTKENERGDSRAHSMVHIEHNGIFVLPLFLSCTESFVRALPRVLCIRTSYIRACRDTNNNTHLHEFVRVSIVFFLYHCQLAEILYRNSNNILRYATCVYVSP